MYWPLFETGIVVPILLLLCTQFAHFLACISTSSAASIRPSVGVNIAIERSTTGSRLPSRLAETCLASEHRREGRSGQLGGMVPPCSRAGCILSWSRAQCPIFGLRLQQPLLAVSQASVNNLPDWPVRKRGKLGLMASRAPRAGLH